MLHRCIIIMRKFFTVMITSSQYDVITEPLWKLFELQLVALGADKILPVRSFTGLVATLLELLQQIWLLSTSLCVPWSSVLFCFFSFSSAKWCSLNLAQFWDKMHCRICPKNYHSHHLAVVGDDPTSLLYRSALLIILWPYLKLTLLYIHLRSVCNKTHWSCLHLTFPQHSYIHCNTRTIYTAIIKPNLNLAVPLLYW